MSVCVCLWVDDHIWSGIKTSRNLVYLKDAALVAFIATIKDANYTSLWLPLHYLNLHILEGWQFVSPHSHKPGFRTLKQNCLFLKVSQQCIIALSHLLAFQK